MTLAWLPSLAGRSVIVALPNQRRRTSHRASFSRNGSLDLSILLKMNKLQFSYSRIFTLYVNRLEDRALAVPEAVGLWESEGDDEGHLAEQSEGEKAVEGDGEEVRGHSSRDRRRRRSDLVLEGLLKRLRTQDALLSKAQNLPGEIFWLSHGGRIKDFETIEVNLG